MAASISQLLGLSVILALLYVCGVVIYRLTLHPLAKYPGPLLSRATNWHNYYHAVKSDRHLELWRQHEIYGSVVRFRPNALSFNTTSALQDIYSSRKANVIKGDWYLMVQAGAGGGVSTFTERDRTAHAAKRRLLAHGFSDHAIKSLEPKVIGNVEKWCSLIGNADNGEWSEDRNMSDWSNYLTFDILGELCFSKSFRMLDRNENRYIIDLIGGATKMSYVSGQSPFRALLRKVILSPLGAILAGEVARQNEKFHSFGWDALVQREKLESEQKAGSGDGPKDFFHFLFRGKDPETGIGYTRETLEAESELLIIAGSDTSSTVLAATFFYLVRNTRVLQKLTEEIRKTFSSMEEIRGSNPKLASLTYLQAVLNEAMRMSPPVGAHIPREVLPGGATIDGYEIPPRTVVGVATYALQHNEAYVLNPFHFWPERWIEDEAAGVTAESVEMVRAAFCPFSVGPRGCIGKNLAYMELTSAMGRILWQYDIKAANDNTLGEGSSGKEWGRRRKDEFQMEDNFVAARDGPVINLKRRLK